MTEVDSASNIISLNPLIKSVPIQSMSAVEKIAFQQHLRDAYRRSLDKNNIAYEQPMGNLLKRKCCIEEEQAQEETTEDNSTEEICKMTSPKRKRSRKEKKQQQQPEEDDNDSGNSTEQTRTSSPKSKASKMVKALNDEFPLMPLKGRNKGLSEQPIKKKNIERMITRKVMNGFVGAARRKGLTEKNGFLKSSSRAMAKRNFRPQQTKQLNKHYTTLPQRNGHLRKS